MGGALGRAPQPSHGGARRHRQGRYLTGPINRWVYGSFAPKKHAFVIARREANKRGFTPGSAHVIQLLTDGDDDLAVYAKTYFPEARHTLDVVHVVEKLWQAGECVHKEGSEALEEWVALQKQRLYAGQVAAIIGELVQQCNAIPKTGPGNKGKRQRLAMCRGPATHRRVPVAG